jgi:hypothetical protein
MSLKRFGVGCGGTTRLHRGHTVGQGQILISFWDSAATRTLAISGPCHHHTDTSNDLGIFLIPGSVFKLDYSKPGEMK